LRNISLARPFQLHQSVSIIRQLVNEINRSTEVDEPIKPQLIIVTDISAQFFDPTLASEDKAYPVPQLELLRHVLGILQGLAVAGNVVIMTDQTKRKKAFTEMNQTRDNLNRRVQATCLAYASNIHIRIETIDKERKTYLFNHPFLPPTRRSVKQHQRLRKIDVQQTTLDGWY
jgi:hypothetical protein